MVLAITMASMPVAAQSYDPTQGIPHSTGLEKAMTKLGRGLANVMFGWAEVPVTFDKKMKQGKPLSYLLGVVPVAAPLVTPATAATEVEGRPS